VVEEPVLEYKDVDDGSSVLETKRPIRYSRLFRLQVCGTGACGMLPHFNVDFKFNVVEVDEAVTSSSTWS
jgi:hypothetical protein